MVVILYRDVLVFLIVAWVFEVLDLKSVSFIMMVLNNINLIRKCCDLPRFGDGFEVGCGFDKGLLVLWVLGEV